MKWEENETLLTLWSTYSEELTCSSGLINVNPLRFWRGMLLSSLSNTLPAGTEYDEFINHVLQQSGFGKLWKLTSEWIHVIKVELWSRYYCSETNLSASPPVFRTTGIVPYRIAYICVQEFLWYGCQNSIKCENPHFHRRLMVEKLLSQIYKFL